MQTVPRRFGLATIMIAVAVFAVSFGCLGVPGGSVAIVAAGIAYAPIGLFPAGRRLAAWAWVFSIYPTLLMGCLYLAWGSAWGVLGHRPSPVFEAPYRIGPVVAGIFVTTNLLMFGLPFSFIGCLAFSKAESKRRFAVAGRRTAAAFSAILGPLAWALAYAFLRWDPFRVLAWFLA